MKLLILVIIFSLFTSCSSKIKGRNETKIAKRNFLTAADMRYLEKDYDWEVAYDSNTDYYAKELKSTKIRMAKKDKLQTRELRSILKDSYIQSIKSLKIEDENLEQGALMTEKLFRYLSKKNVISKADLDNAISDYIYENKLKEDSYESKVVLNHSRKVAEYLGFKNNFEKKSQENLIGEKERAPASEVSLTDIINKEKIEFKEIRELDYVKILVKPSEFASVIQGIVSEERESFARLSDQDLNVVGNLFIDRVKDLGYLNTSKINVVTKNISNFVKRGKFVTEEKNQDLNTFLTSIRRRYKRLVRSRIKAKVLQDRTLTKKYTHFSNKEIQYQLQEAYETKQFEDPEVARKLAKKIHSYLTKYTLYNEGLNRDQFEHVFELIKDRVSRPEILPALNYYREHLLSYVDRSRKFNSFKNVREKFVKNERPYFVIDELPSELKGIVDEKNAFLLSITLEERKGLMELKKENSLYMRDLLASAREQISSGRSIASVKKDQKVFKLHGIDGDSFFFTGEQLNFFLAAKIATPETLQAIKKLGTDINAKDENGKAALLIAIENERYENVKTLLSLGAKLENVDSKGRTALDYARNSSDSRILDVVRDYYR